MITLMIFCYGFKIIGGQASQHVFSSQGTHNWGAPFRWYPVQRPDNITTLAQDSEFKYYLASNLIRRLDKHTLIKNLSPCS